MPHEHTQGTHITLDLAGGARFGPDEEWVDFEDYKVDIRCVLKYGTRVPHPARPRWHRRADRFYAAVREYWPGLPDGVSRLLCERLAELLVSQWQGHCLLAIRVFDRSFQVGSLGSLPRVALTANGQVRTARCRTSTHRAATSTACRAC